MIKQLKPFQELGVNFLTKNVHALLADDMGLGKTLQTIRALERLMPSSVLIVCPASMRFTWLKAVKDDGELFLKTSILKGDAKQREEIVFECLICSYEFLVGNLYFFQNLSFDVLICDEAHYLRTLTSKRSAAVLGHFGVARNCTYKWMLTGTPIHNRPINLFPILCTLAGGKLGDFNTYDSFARRYCGGPLAFGSTRQAELRSRLSGFMLRRLKTEVLEQLPSLETEIVLFDPSPIPALMREIKCGNKIEISIKSKFNQVDPTTITMNLFGELAAHRQQLALAKIPLILAHMDDLLESENKIVVFFYHIAVMRALTTAILGKYESAIYYGGLPPMEKERQKAKFIENKEVRIFFGQVNAAGTGLDGLQTVCSTVIFTEWDWTPGGNSQAVSRLHRMGQINPVLAQFLVIKDSWEEKMLDRTETKQDNIDKILNSTKETEYELCL